MNAALPELKPLRAPPSDADVEMALIAVVLQGNEQYFVAAEHVSADDFADQAYGRLFEIMGEIIKKGGRGASPATVAAAVKDEPGMEEVGSIRYLTRFAVAPVALENAERYAIVTRDLADRRRVLEVCEDTTDRIGDSNYVDVPVEEIATETIHRIQEITHRRPGTELTRRRVLIELTEGLNKELPCYSTGLHGLDQALGSGLYAGRAYGIAARKKVGKTCLAATISFNLNERAIPHLFVCGEMSAEEIEHRNVGRALGFNSLRFLNPNTRKDRDFQLKVAEYATTAPDYIRYVNEPGLTFDRLRRLVERAAGNGAKGFILDYLQLVGGQERGQSRAEHLDAVAQWIASACRRHGMFALVLAQINQGQNPNIRGGEGMRLAFDLVMALHREEHNAWLEMWESRYTPWQNVGSKENPGLVMRMDVGPFFEDAP